MSDQCFRVPGTTVIQLVGQSLSWSGRLVVLLVLVLVALSRALAPLFSGLLRAQLPSFGTSQSGGGHEFVDYHTHTITVAVFRLIRL